MNSYMTETEETIMYKFIFLPLSKLVLEADIKEINNSKVRFAHQYCNYIHLLMDEISHELFEARKQARSLNMKVWKVKQEKTTPHHTYRCVYRGFQKDFHFSKHALRDETEKMLLIIHQRTNKNPKELKKSPS